MVGLGATAVLLAVALGWWGQGHRGEEKRTARARSAGTRSGTKMPREPMKPASLSGRVTRASDETAVAGAIVVIVIDGPQSWTEPTAPLVLTSDEDGRWAASAVAPATYVLTTTAVGFMPHVRETLVLAPDEQRANVDVTLVAGGALVTGTITTDAHAPIANAEIRASRASDTPSFIALSGSDGRYQLSLAPGRYTLEVTALRRSDCYRAGVVASPNLLPAVAGLRMQRWPRESAWMLVGSWCERSASGTEKQRRKTSYGSWMSSLRSPDTTANTRSGS